MYLICFPSFLWFLLSNIWKQLLIDLSNFMGDSVRILVWYQLLSWLEAEIWSAFFFSCSCYMMFRRKLCRLNKQKKLSIFLQDLEILIHGADSKYVLISRAALPHFAFGVLAVCHICLWACQYFDPQLLRDSVLAWAPSLSRISNLIPQLCPCLVLVFGYPGSWGRIQYFIE